MKVFKSDNDQDMLDHMRQSEYCIIPGCHRKAEDPGGYCMAHEQESVDRMMEGPEEEE